MLYPQFNALRQVLDLSGFWDFRAETIGIGAGRDWSAGFDGARPVAVPASWNEQLADVYNYWNDAWYQTLFDQPWGWDGRRVMLRFGSVNYLAEVWLNGVRLGGHEGGHLPFEFDVTEHLRAEGNRLVVRVNGEPLPDRIPPGGVRQDPLDNFRLSSQHPVTSYDFFPFSGIHRPVLLYATDPQAIMDLTVVTEIEDGTGRVRVTAACGARDGLMARLTLAGHGAPVTGEVPVTGGAAQATLEVPGAALWSPQAPHLYDLAVDLLRDGAPVDRYTLPVGVRTVAVDGDRLLLNDEPVTLTGFGRHEDFPLAGRGYVPTAIIKDYDLMRWVGANSFRTTHYPYSEQMLFLADRLGFLVIDETPAVEMYFHEDGLAQRMVTWKQLTRETIARDKNHPSVIMWSLANEPHNRRPEAKAAFREVFELARSLDDTRPLTFASALGLEDQAIELCDVICINRYRGWYTESGQLDEGLAVLEAELDELHRTLRRPVIITEFGADTVPGLHHDPPVMFSEEYQAEMLARYITLFNRKPYIVGQHVWNLCDFRTGQTVTRIGGMNLKGVFTRDRRPKLAAHRLRELWKGTD